MGGGLQLNKVTDLKKLERIRGVENIFESLPRGCHALQGEYVIRSLREIKMNAGLRHSVEISRCGKRVEGLKPEPRCGHNANFYYTFLTFHRKSSSGCPLVEQDFQTSSHILNSGQHVSNQQSCLSSLRNRIKLSSKNSVRTQYFHYKATIATITPAAAPMRGAPVITAALGLEEDADCAELPVGDGETEVVMTVVSPSEVVVTTVCVGEAAPAVPVRKEVTSSVSVSTSPSSSVVVRVVV